MEHIDRFSKLDDVTDAMFHRGMNSNLTDAGTDRRYRLPIGRLQTLLNLPELKACEASGIPRKYLHVTPR
jgi:hypothetical protein